MSPNEEAPGLKSGYTALRKIVELLIPDNCCLCFESEDAVNLKRRMNTFCIQQLLQGMSARTIRVLRRTGDHDQMFPSLTIDHSCHRQMLCLLEHLDCF